MLSMDVPIMVFHMAKLEGNAEKGIKALKTMAPRSVMLTEAVRPYMVTMLGFLAACSLSGTLKAVPRGL